MKKNIEIKEMPALNLVYCRDIGAFHLINKAYEKLFKYSRRSRYLVNENHSNPSTEANFTYEKHLAKAVRHLDKLILKFQSMYSTNYPVIEIKCSYLKKDELTFFKKLEE